MMNLFDEGERDQVPGHNAVVHQLQEGGESEGQHLTKAEERKEKSVQVTTNIIWAVLEIITHKEVESWRLQLQQWTCYSVNV